MKTRNQKRGVISSMLLLFVLAGAAGMLSGCDQGAEVAAIGSTRAAPTTESVTVVPTATQVPSPTVAPTMTPAETLAPTPTTTTTPMPTHPLMINVMRERTYPGSELVVEEILASGSNYDRSIVSYLSEGLKIYALLTVPRGEKPETGWPVVIFNHGYIPPNVYRTTERYTAYTDAFSRNGYILLRSDYRGHGSSEGAPSSSHISPGYTVDVLNGMTSVMRHPDADPDRVGFWGHSMGGSITLRAMVVTDVIKVGVIWAGVTAPYPVVMQRWVTRWADRPTATRDPQDTPSDWVDEFYDLDNVEENQDFWNAIDPFAYLDEISGPIQIHHGTADDSVPVEFSEILHMSLLEAGQVSEVYIYEGDNHNLSNNFGRAAQRSVEFFDLYLKDLDE